MLSPQEVLEAARSKWPLALRAEATGENIFPLVIRFGRPSTTENLGAIRAQLESLVTADYGWDVEKEEINTRKWGKQLWPRRISFESVEKLAAALKLGQQLARFREALAFAREQCVKLEPWLQSQAHRIPELFPEWKELVCICAYFDAHPTPNCYPRQLPVPIGTKFIEEHTGILGEMLTVVLGDRANLDGIRFEERFHLRTEPPQVRICFLDDALRERAGWPVMDSTIFAENLACLEWAIPQVLIVENKAVFLCLPEMPDTLAILGSGKAVSLCHACSWMDESEIVYWGDCDEAGFGILSLLRSRFPQVRSVLMDKPTWEQWNGFATPGKRDPGARFDHLTALETEALDAIMTGPWMLEQERIPAEAAEKAIQSAFVGFEPRCPG